MVDNPSSIQGAGDAGTDDVPPAKRRRRRRRGRGADPARVRRLRPLSEEVTQLPNLLTLGRIATLPLVLAFIDNYSRLLSFTSAVIFLAGVITDVLDGYLARRRGQVTVLGQFLDPLADKLFVLGVLVFLVARDRVAEWLVVVLMSRELAVTGLRSIASSYGLVIAAGGGGKAKTALQSVGLVFLLLHFPYKLIFFDYVVDFHNLGTYLLYLSLVMSVWSFGEYLRFFVRAAEEKAKRSREP
ncbi:MAG: CDP-diacylglycerol--glycerol-3-phosphate 3-phosphatidyltransferase [Deltaproteobacteria bacterium]|nr:CDP-diacylglycerol--glycerol-3-phosphate 3-phosphatidyltransferase [Deltaproteobacteria bacterium]